MYFDQVDSEDEDEEGAVSDGDDAADPARQAVENPDSLEDDLEVEDAENVPANRGDGQGASVVAAAGKKGGPTMLGDYRAWIKARKGAWRTHRAALKAIGRGAVDGAPVALAGLGGGMQKQVEAIMHATWNIIQVRQMGVLDPGAGLGGYRPAGLVQCTVCRRWP